MIEILPGVYFDPSKEWYEQDPALIALASEIEQTEPIGSESESEGENTRLLWAEWEATTECGTFTMHIQFNWLYAISFHNFMAKVKHDTVTIIKIA